MNKLFFAKYLPVEGVVEKGDKYYFKDDPNNILVRTGDLTSPSLQKVKLFLCSRDIQIGDTNIRLGLETSVGSLTSQVNVDYTKGLGGYKVIGEISPEATWVKEGDEFDDKDINLTKYYWHFSKIMPDSHFNTPTRYPYYISHRLYDEGKDEHSNIYSYEVITGECIKIKGPCGHFH